MILLKVVHHVCRVTGNIYLKDGRFKNAILTRQNCHAKYVDCQQRHRLTCAIEMSILPANNSVRVWVTLSTGASDRGGATMPARWQGMACAARLRNSSGRTLILWDRVIVSVVHQHSETQTH